MRDYETAIREAEKLDLEESHWYHELISDLYKQLYISKEHFVKAVQLAKTGSDKQVLERKLKLLA